MSLSLFKKAILWWPGYLANDCVYDLYSCLSGDSQRVLTDFKKGGCYNMFDCRLYIFYIIMFDYFVDCVAILNFFLFESVRYCGGPIVSKSGYDEVIP